MIIVDRIEGAIAVLEVAETIIEVPLSELPEGVQEGDSLVLTPAPCDIFARAGHNETVERVERLRALDSGEKEIDI
jgi:hypothetical protein